MFDYILCKEVTLRETRHAYIIWVGKSEVKKKYLGDLGVVGRLEVKRILGENRL